MNTDTEIILSFDGEQWIVNLEDQRFISGELRELENRIIEFIRKKPCYANREFVRVWVGFDYDTIPDWLRQYHTHYFNYHLTVSIPRNNCENQLKT